MSLDYSYKDVTNCRALFKKSDDCVSEGNIIIPDSMDDIAKIISVSATAYVTECNADDLCCGISGYIKLNVIYIGENEPSKICSLAVTNPFSHSINMENLTKSFTPIAEISSVNVNYSVVNSRRLKTSSSIRFMLSCYDNASITVLTQADSAQTKSKEVSFLSYRAAISKNIVISDNISLPAGKSAITKILRQCADITEYDFKALSNKIIVKGNIRIHILYCSEDSICDAGMSIPFTEVIEAEGISPSSQTNLTLSVADCEISPDTDLSGEYKMLDASIVLSCHITSFSKETLNVITDIYLPGSSLKTSICPISLNSGNSYITEDEFIKECITIQKNTPVSRIIDIECSPGDASLEDNLASGFIDITIIYQGGDSSLLNSHSAKIPVSHKFTQSNLKNLALTVSGISFAITSDDTLELRIPLTFSAISVNDENINVVTDCIEEECQAPKRPSIIVCVVAAGDCMWDIAKKYNISLSHLAAANNLTCDSVLTVGEKLIIPR